MNTQIDPSALYWAYFKTPMNAEPKRLKCPNCHGKKWFPHPDLGPISCQVCDATGEGGIDVVWLIEDWKRLKAIEHKKADLSFLDEALNSGDGTYKP